MFTADVFPDCPDAACTEKRLKERAQSKIKARVAERLLYPALGLLEGWPAHAHLEGAGRREARRWT